ncbi:MAG TPA: hypothetical protein PKZ76_07700 [Xanthomonadaceae bacterium]|nr:hypothetical protein [Xanthomonadaceae bacterium]
MLKRNRHWIVLILFLLSFLYNAVVWGGLLRIPQMGPVALDSAKREAPLVLLYMRSGELLAQYGLFVTSGERMADRAFGLAEERLRISPRAAMDILTGDAMNASHRWLKLNHWLAPVLLLLGLFLLWRRPKSVHMFGPK